MTTLLQKSELRRAQVERSCRSREQRKANAHERILLRAFQWKSYQMINQFRAFCKEDEPAGTIRQVSHPENQRLSLHRQMGNLAVEFQARCVTKRQVGRKMLRCWVKSEMAYVSMSPAPSLRLIANICGFQLSLHSLANKGPLAPRPVLVPAAHSPFPG